MPLRDTFHAAYEPILTTVIVQDIKDNHERSRRLRRGDFMSLGVAMQELGEFMGPLTPQLFQAIFRWTRHTIDRTNTLAQLAYDHPEMFDAVFEACREDAQHTFPNLNWDEYPHNVNGY